MVNISKSIDEFLKEIETGRVETKENIYNIKIYVNEVKSDELIPILKIRNKETFRMKIEEYINKLVILNPQTIVDNNFIKDTLSHLFANATFTDLENPEIFIDKYIHFLDKPNLSIKEITGIFNEIVNESDIAFNSTLSGYIERQSIFQETPYVFKTTIMRDIGKKTLKYNLPNISFGIYGDTCYIYAIQNGKSEIKEPFEIKYEKRIKRLLYKIDDKVKENEKEEYLDYKQGISDYYPENITDVVPSAILSLSLFLTTLFQNNITKVNVVSYLPIRYNAKKVAFTYMAQAKKKRNRLTDIQMQQLIEQYELEQLRIQKNMTQKLLRNFNRLKFHFSNIEFQNFPFENGEYMSIKLYPFQSVNNCILEKLLENDSKRLK